LKETKEECIERHQGLLLKGAVRKQLFEKSGCADLAETQDLILQERIRHIRHLRGWLPE